MKIDFKNELKPLIRIFKDKEFWKNYVKLMMFPILITIVFIIFKGTNFLKFDFNNLSNFWTFFTHSFFHQDWNHLIGNLVGYISITTLLCILYFRNKMINVLNKTYLFIILSVPFVASIGQIILTITNFIPNIPPSSGSSDIVSALIGLGLFSIIIFFNTFNVWDTRIILLIYLISLFLVVRYPFSGLTSMFIMVIPVYLYLLVRSFKMKTKIFDLAYLIILVVIVGAYTSFLFPREIVKEGALINIIGHYIGLCYGLFIGYFIYKKIGIRRVFIWG